MENATQCPTTKAACRFRRLGVGLILSLIFLCIGYCVYKSICLQNDVVQLREQLVSQSGISSQLQQRLQSQQTVLASLQAGEKVWVLKETEYLIRLAQMRMNFLQDVPTALAQLLAADQRIASLVDPKVLPIRQQLAHDIGVLRAYQSVDTQGIWLRLSALKDSMETLPLMVTLEGDSTEHASPGPASLEPGAIVATASQWRLALLHSWQEIKSMVKIRRHDEAMLTPILGVSDRQRLQQTVISLIEQAKWAVLNRNVMIYQQSLEALLQGLPLFLSMTQSQLAALETEIRALQQIDIALPLPVLTATITQLEASNPQDASR